MREATQSRPGLFNAQVSKGCKSYEGNRGLRGCCILMNIALMRMERSGGFVTHLIFVQGLGEDIDDLSHPRGKSRAHAESNASIIMPQSKKIRNRKGNLLDLLLFYFIF